MARGEILRQLFKSFSQEDREAFYAAATQLIEEEKNKNHLLLAKDLESIIKKKSNNGYASNQATTYYYPEIPTDKDSGLPLIEVKNYQYSLERVVLSSENLEIIERIIIENRKKEILNSYGLKPISKILFCGLPGCDKTLTAQVLSGVLELPLVYVNLSSVFSSYLGETAVNLKKIFDYVKQGEVKISSQNWKYDRNSMYVVVACNRKWAREEDINSQRYALVVSVSHSNAEVNLYNQLQAQVQNKISQRVRIR